MKFSIVLPTYNRASLLPRAISSVLNQTYPNWELIIVNDGSTDNTKEVVGRFLCEDSRIRFISYERNRGVNYARNRGIENSTGDIITFLDSDDMFFDYTLEKAKEFIEKKPEYDLYAFATKAERGRKRLSIIPYDGYSPSYEEIISNEKVRGEFLNFVRSYVFKEFRFYEDINGFEGLIWWQIAKKYKIIYSSRLLRIYGDSENSLTRVKMKDYKFWLNLKNAMERKIEIFGDDLKKFNRSGYEGYAHTLALLGRAKLKTGDLIGGFKYTFKALVYSPLEIRAWRNLLLIF